MRGIKLSLLALVLLPVLPLAVSGCQALQNGAPPVTPAMVRSAGDGAATLESLDGGRRLLARRCTNCHGLEPVPKYTASEWKANVERMAPRAGLSEAETREITAYLIAARRSLP